MKWIDFKEWWFERNPGLIEQIEKASAKDYEDISVEELEKFIKDLQDGKVED